MNVKGKTVGKGVSTKGRLMMGNSRFLCSNSLLQDIYFLVVIAEVPGHYFSKNPRPRSRYARRWQKGRVALLPGCDSLKGLTFISEQSLLKS
jgi:hypothetical protein